MRESLNPRKNACKRKGRNEKIKILFRILPPKINKIPISSRTWHEREKEKTVNTLMVKTAKALMRELYDQKKNNNK